MSHDIFTSNTNRPCTWANGINSNATNQIDVECCSHRLLNPNSLAKYMCISSGPCHLANSVNLYLLSLSRLRRLPK